MPLELPLSPETFTQFCQRLAAGGDAAQRTLSGAHLRLSSPDDLTREELSIPEEWIPNLLTCDRISTQPIDAETMELTRKKIWDLVFREWHTDKPIKKPRVAPSRTADESTLQIGVLTKDAAVSSQKRKAGQESMAVPAHRRAGAAVYIKVKPNSQMELLDFPLCDSRGANFATDIEFSRLPGTTAGNSYGDCTKYYDQAEL
ncbi:hypothetical protein CMUS01_12711 [Colletotrichum musicola]|uniref:Uncharacterized protein n=1 Tax=Colletotrichum musicola TaxID=2175873 RepID=A0A8H6JJ45_9PEZI|nr:hypothetical protein CMUS01_12711 [Colletotrichum musicola]